MEKTPPHGDLLQNGGTVATFLSSPSFLSWDVSPISYEPPSIPRRAVPSPVVHVGLPHESLLAVSLLKAPRSGLLCNLCSVYASFPSCVRTHDLV